MKRWVAVGVLGLALAGCATGLPGSPRRHLYSLCMVEGREPGYCEAWAAVEADKLEAGRVGLGMVVTMPIGR